MIVQCASCGQKNRVPDSSETKAEYRCGKCGTRFELVWAERSSASRSDEGRAVPDGVTMTRTILTRAGDLLVVISIFLLFLAVPGWPWRWPSYFYTLLRFAVCGSAMYLALAAWWLDTRPWTLIMSGIAILFNPNTVHLNENAVYFSHESERRTADGPYHC